MRQIVKLTSALTVLTLGLAACGSTGDKAEINEIKLGAVYALTGPNAAYGEPEGNAAKVLVESINENGGVDGKKIRLLLEDSESNPTVAARRAQELVSKGVVAVVGGTTGSGSIAMAPITHQAKIPLLSVAGTTEVTDPKANYYKSTFRASLSDSVVIPATFEELKEADAKRVAIFAQNDAYGDFGVKNFKKTTENEDSDIKIVEIATAPLDATNVGAQVRKIADAKPDNVVLQLSSVDLAAAFLRDARKIGLDVPFWGGTGMGQQVLLDNAGDAASNLIVASAFEASQLNPKQEDLVKLLEDGGYKFSGGFGEMVGATSIEAFVEAYKNVGSENPDGEDLIKSFNDGFSVDGYLASPMKFSSDFHDGCTKECVVWVKVEDGKFVRR